MVPDQLAQSFPLNLGRLTPLGTLKVVAAAPLMRPEGTVPPEPDAPVPPDTPPVPVEGSGIIVPPGVVVPGAAGVVEEAICGMIYLLPRSSQQQCFIVCKPKEDGLLLLSVILYGQNAARPAFM